MLKKTRNATKEDKRKNTPVSEKEANDSVENGGKFPIIDIGASAGGLEAIEA